MEADAGGAVVAIAHGRLEPPELEEETEGGWQEQERQRNIRRKVPLGVRAWAEAWGFENTARPRGTLGVTAA